MFFDSIVHYLISEGYFYGIYFILNQMLTARGLTPNTILSYQTLAIPGLPFRPPIFPEDASWQDMRGFLTFIQKSRSKNHTDSYVPMPDSILENDTKLLVFLSEKLRPKKRLFTQQHSLENPMDKQ